MLIQQSLRKYPTDVIIKLEESKEPNTPCHCGRQLLSILQYKKMFIVERAKFNESIRSLHRSSAEGLTNSVNTSNGQMLLPCIFCKEVIIMMSVISMLIT